MGVINKSFISTDEGQLYCRQLGDGKPLLLLQTIRQVVHDELDSCISRLIDQFKRLQP